MNKTLMNRSGVGVLLAVLLIGPVALVGCQKTSPPRRVPPGETTDAELNDPRQLPVSFEEFESGAVADLLQKLPTARGISDTQGRVTVLLGDINNTTGIVSTTDYEFVMSGIRSQLIQSGASSVKLNFVERRRRVEDLAARERVATAPAPAEASGNEIRWSGGSYYVPDYDASTSYGLYLDVYRVGRGNTNQYRMVLQVVSLATNDIVYSYMRDTKQVSR